jgi:hypothetical protein
VLADEGLVLEPLLEEVGKFRTKAGCEQAVHELQDTRYGASRGRVA